MKFMASIDIIRKHEVINQSQDVNKIDNETSKDMV